MASQNNTDHPPHYHVHTTESIRPRRIISVVWTPVHVEDTKLDTVLKLTQSCQPCSYYMVLVAALTGLLCTAQRPPLPGGGYVSIDQH